MSQKDKMINNEDKIIQNKIESETQNKMNLPTEEQCLEYFNKYKVPQNIKEHCLRVKDVAVFIAERLQEKGIPVSIELVSTGALLHDLFKLAALKSLKPTRFYENKFSDEELEFWEEFRGKYSGKFENEIAYEVFKDEFPELALFIREACNPHKKEKNWSQLALHYADIRIFQNRIVSLIERFTYFRQAYEASSLFWDEYLDFMQEEERRIFKELDFSPEELGEMFRDGKTKTK